MSLFHTDPDILKTSTKPGPQLKLAGNEPAPAGLRCFNCNGPDPKCPTCKGSGWEGGVPPAPVAVPPPISSKDAVAKSAARITQRLALESAERELHPNVQTIVVSLLYRAGRAREESGRVTGGLTIQELAVSVSAIRGKTTKETTITQPLKNLRGGEIFDDAGNLIRVDPEYVRDSGRTRIGNDGKACTVWEHTVVIGGLR